MIRGRATNIAARPVAADFGLRTGALPTEGATARLRPKGRDQNWALRDPLGRVGEHDELADLASFPVSDSAGCINREMVMLDGGAHPRSSAAEDLSASNGAR